MSMILTNLKERRQLLWDQMKALADTAAAANRSFSEEEQAAYDIQNEELDALDTRIKSVVAAEARGQAGNAKLDALMAQPGQRTYSADDRELDRAFRSAILARNPAPIEIPPTTRGYSQPGVERRDLLKTTPTQALPVSTYDRVVAHLLEGSAVLAAGATVINTESGENLVVPKSTAFSTAALTAEGASITESDPTLGVVTLGAFKYGAFFQVSYELAKDQSSDLLGFLSKQAAEALAQVFGAHLMTGTGSGQPRGAVLDATVGTTGPVGTATTFGNQATAGQGTDLLNSLYGSVAEPYTLSPAVAFLARNATITAIRNLKTTAGEIVGAQFLDASPAPWFVDPFVAAMAANAKSVVFGDWSRYFVRIAGGLRFERSDDFAFQSDLVSFRCLIRLDGALVDNSALKVFQHSAT